MGQRSTLVVSLILLLTVLADLGDRHAPLCAAVVTLEDNGYRGLVVAIHKDVPDTPDLVTRIKDTISKASKHLHSATRHRAYFDEVTIVVPGTWNQDEGYEVVQGGDRFTRAEVRVDKPNPSFGHSPYTEQPGECGEPGEFIHLTPEFLLGAAGDRPTSGGAVGDDEQADAPAPVDAMASEDYSEFWPYGDPARVFVHEWAHLRYGTFDEHGYQSDQQNPEFYMDADNMIRPTGCTDNIRGWLRNTGGDPCVLDVNGLPNADCLFYPDLEGAAGNASAPGKASVMYMPALDMADGFCDDESEDRKHNSMAPNKHNLMCQGRSTWDVISKHLDFQGGRNPPNDLVEPFPKFRVIQPKRNQRPTFVLVLDISGSMKGRRMDLLRAAASRFIKFQLSDFCTVGMVAFSTNALTLANMTLMSDHTRDTLLDQVPKEDDSGFTAIGLGVKEALKLLKSSREPTEGTLLLLVSDGEENVGPYVNDVLEEIIQSKVIINTVAFGRHASNKLENLVKRTGGRGFFYDDEKVSHKMLDTAFVESAATHADIEIQPIEIVNRYVTLKSYEESDNHFIIDKDVGKNTLFLVSYDYPVPQSSPEPISVLLWSPKGKKYSSVSSEYKSDRNTLSISVKITNAEPGKWKYWVKNTQTEVVDVTTMVKSETVDIKEQPIRVRSWVSDVDFSFPQRVKVYAEVKKGYNPVVDATIIATIGRPQGEPWVMMLFDNGAGADTKQDDGIYSGYFAHFNGSGRYSVEAVVLNNGKARIHIGGMNPESRAPRLPILPKAKKGGEEADSAQSSFSPTDLRTPTDQEIYDEFDEEDRRRQRESATYHAIDDFERFASAGAFRLKDWKDADIIPPSRVTDLKVREANLPLRTVHLEWTSPGDDMDDGQAVLTEIRYHHDPLFLLQSFSRAAAATKLLEGDFRPPKAREAHIIRIEMPSESEQQLNASNNRLYFAVRGRDEAGNTGDVSNLALAHFRDPMEGLRIVRGDPHYLERVLWAVAVTVVCALIVLIICVIAFKVRSNRRKKYECQRRQHSGKQTGADDRKQADKLLA